MDGDNASSRDLSDYAVSKQQAEAVAMKVPGVLSDEDRERILNAQDGDIEGDVEVDPAEKFFDTGLLPVKPNRFAMGYAGLIFDSLLADAGEPWEFAKCKDIPLEKGPLDRCQVRACVCDPDGLLYFFREFAGEIEQAVYRIVLKEREREKLSDAATDDERKAYREKWDGVKPEYDWIGEYVGKRRVVAKMVNGIKKGS